MEMDGDELGEGEEETDMDEVRRMTRLRGRAEQPLGVRPQLLLPPSVGGYKPVQILNVCVSTCLQIGSTLRVHLDLQIRGRTLTGKVVAKFYAKYLHREVLKIEGYSAGDLGTAVHRAFFRMDEMMRGQRGWRELHELGDKINQFTGMIEGLIWSRKGSDSNDQNDDWAFEEAIMLLK